MFLDDVRDYLTAQGVVTSAWPAYIGYLPDDADCMIGLFATGGYPADTLSRENSRPTFQTVVRGPEFGYSATHDKWEEVFDALQDAAQMSGSPTLLPGVAFIQAMMTEPLVFPDPKRRLKFISNWRALRTR